MYVWVFISVLASFLTSFWCFDNTKTNFVSSLILFGWFDFENIFKFYPRKITAIRKCLSMLNTLYTKTVNCNCTLIICVVCKYDANCNYEWIDFTHAYYIEYVSNYLGFLQQISIFKELSTIWISCDRKHVRLLMNLLL